ncbi:MAG: DUF975 family protein [Ruminococcaceae bacterium]|nr:DUF975 family protein [Oscillospiraceae bacterium]
MTVPNYHELRQSARRSLDAARNPKKIILIHTGIVVLVSLALMLADYLLEQQIGTTGGLSGMGMRSVLETVRSVLQMAQSMVLPFWQMGYLYYTLKLAQGEDVGTAGLTEGFRRFASVLRLKLLMALILFLVMMASSYLASAIFMFTPFSDPLIEALAPMMDGTMDPEAMLEAYEALPLSAVLPMMIIFIVCMIALVIPVYYRFRMADLWLMDHPESGARTALFASRKMMRGNCMAVFKIDLHFWWFFVLDLLVTFLCYGDMMLTSLGITLPISADLAFYLFFVLYLVAQLGLYYWRQNEVSVTYAHLYEALKPTEQA